MSMMSTKYKISLAIFVVLALLAGAYFFFTKGGTLKTNTPTAAEVKKKGPPPPVVPDGWKKFENVQYSFSLFVPPELIVTAFDEGGGAHTFTFEDEASERGFQIFVVPYSGTSVTPERFRKDSPSGVMKEPVDVVIGGPVELGGVIATAFFGEHSVMGETREVWFIYGNYLYEVTTYKKDDVWLAGIMDMWRFAL